MLNKIHYLSPSCLVSFHTWISICTTKEYKKRNYKELSDIIIFKMFCKADQPPQNSNFKEKAASQSQSLFVSKACKQAKKAPTLKLSNPRKYIYLKTQKYKCFVYICSESQDWKKLLQKHELQHTAIQSEHI